MCARWKLWIFYSPLHSHGVEDAVRAPPQTLKPAFVHQVSGASFFSWFFLVSFFLYIQQSSFVLLSHYCRFIFSWLQAAPWKNHEAAGFDPQVFHLGVEISSSPCSQTWQPQCCAVASGSQVSLPGFVLTYARCSCAGKKVTLLPRPGPREDNLTAGPSSALFLPQERWGHSFPHKRVGYSAEVFRLFCTHISAFPKH